MNLPQNAIKSVTLEGIVQDGTTDESIPVTLHRMTAPLNLVHSHYHPRPSPSFASLLLESVPERLPSLLPPPGEAQLHARLGKFVGDGHSSVVFELDDVRLDNPSPDQQHVPRLVVKIARSNRLAALARDAWFYDEMESLQGSSIARCYGWFEVELASGQGVPAWSDHPAEDPDEHDPALDCDRVVHPDQLKRTARRDLLSVLVLERLGERLQPGPHPDDVKSDIIGLYEDISRLGVSASRDIRRQNILEAPRDEPCLPSLPSPFTKCTHSWRVVDFEFGFKANYTPLQFKMSYCDLADEMFDDIQQEAFADNGRFPYLVDEGSDSEYETTQYSSFARQSSSESSPTATPYTSGVECTEPVAFVAYV
ncbi:hypothetical protein BV25DRAFT_1839742 [Artomyces pyxidatus]|uniref:Uncharacterized protein n=1 Tax=Artomyces pyxidatus TaxID=48021 RepID=A0ACB8SWI9_9AGAM|nr:hypothetical protein BV25DRAFT_1839742 [Artomyces pyxidatus]